ncbi:hypothetical protein C8F04DRAFT_948395, partial [Mycena alexandri]
MGVHHNIRGIYDATVRETRHALLSHSCNKGCGRTVYIFKVLAKPRRDVDGRRNRYAPQISSESSGSSSSVAGDAELERLSGDASQAAGVEELGDDDHGSLDYLDVPSENLWMDIIKEWQTEMSTERLQLRTCAVCGREECARSVHEYDVSAVNFSLLRNDELPSKVWPTTYNFLAYDRALLCSAGLSDMNNPVKMRVCDDCKTYLDRHLMPKFALANWLYYGREALPDGVREAFDSASIFERMLVSRVRYNSVTCRFKASEYDPTEEVDSRTQALRKARKGIRGNVVVTPLNVRKLQEVLPPPPEIIRDTMSVIFIGSVPPSRETLHRLHPVLVRKSKVKVMLDFLMEHNPHYARLQGFGGYSEQNLNALFDGSDDGLDTIPGSVHVGFLPANNAVDSATGDYTGRNLDEPIERADGVGDEVLMENVGYTLGDESPGSFSDMKMIALERCLAGKSYLGYRKSASMVADFDNPYMLSMAFPEEDPWGIGGFLHPFRRRRISVEEQVSYLLTVHGGRFQRHPEFAFFYYNVLRKQLVSRSMRYRAQKSNYKRVIDDMLGIDLDRLTSLRAKCKKDPTFIPVNAEDKRIMTLVGSVGLIAQQVPGSAGQKLVLRNEIRGMITYRGAPTLFITLNPSDVDNPIVRLLAGDDIVLEDLARGEDMDTWKRKMFAAKNPAACARFFDVVINKFIEVVLRYNRPGRGLFG